MDAPKLRDAADPLPPIDIPTVEAHPTTGVLKGRTVVYRLPPTRMWLAIQRGAFSNLDLYERTLDAVVSHDLGIDLEDATPDIVADLASEWLRAVRERADPPMTGSS